MVALAAGKEAFSDYSHKFSPKKFTQPQLFACLVLKEFEKKDYRGLCALLLDCSDLRAAIELTVVPFHDAAEGQSMVAQAGSSTAFDRRDHSSNPRPRDDHSVCRRGFQWV